MITVAWDGWLLKRTGMDTLYYYAEIDSVTPIAEPTTLVGWFDYNNDVNDTLLFTISGDDTASGSVDVSAFPNGLYRVTFIMTRNRHDTSSSISDERIVRNPNRNFFPSIIHRNKYL